MPEKSMKKRVLYIITKSVWGGAQKYVFDLAVNLPKDKFEAMVAGGGKGVMAEKIISANLPYFEIKNFQRDVNFLKDIFSFFEILILLFKTKPDIVHVSSSKAGASTGLACFIYKFFAFRFSLFALFTVHGWAFLEDRPKWQILLIKLISKITCLFYNKIICVSQNDYNEAMKNKIAPARKIVLIHNGINPDDYNFLDKNTARKSLGSSTSKSRLGVELPSDGEILVGTIGEDTKNKGHQYLREAGEKIPNVNLKIFSNIPNASRYLKNFDIFVLPSIKEGLPYIILEAGLAGLPVVASNVGGISEIIIDGENGILVPPKNPKALAEAIKKLIDNKNLREKMADNLHQRILSEFSMQKMLNATISAYEK